MILAMLLNLLVIINALIMLSKYSMWDTVLFIFIFIVIPVVNLYFIFKIYKKRTEDLTNKNTIIIINLFFNLFIIISSLFAIFIGGKDRYILISLLTTINSILYTFILYKNLNINFKIFFVKLLKYWKWLFIIFITLFIILLISVYISSLNSYKESDFNIPKDFFVTKFWDRDPYSEKNWFEDLIMFIEWLDVDDWRDRYRSQERMKWSKYLNKDIYLEYFDIESKCIFDNIKCEERKKGYFDKMIEEHDQKIDKEISVLRRKYIEVLLKYKNHKETLSNEEKNNYNEYLKEKNNLINKKYIRLEANKIYLLKQFHSYFSIVDLSKEIQITNDKLKELKPTDIEFYKVFDYISDKKVYGEYKEFVDNINKVDENIKTIADVWKIIDKINNWIYVEQKTKDIIKEEIWKLYDNNIKLNDFKIYNDSLKQFEEQKKLIIEKSFKKLRNFVAVNKLKYRKINNKEYILQTPEYSWVLSKTVIYTYIIKYSRSIRYVVYRYFEEWKYEQWINVLLDFQWFIDNLINKYDWHLIGSMVIITINNINNKALEYFIDNYELSDKLKEKIIIALNKNINIWFVKNSIKWEYKIHKEIIEEAFLFNDVLNSTVDRKTWKKENKYKNIKDILEILFFVSKDETNLLLQKVFYDIISDNSLNFVNNLCNNRKLDFNFSNLNNYIWRNVICNNWLSVFSSQFQKEQNMRDLRAEILEKLK